MGEEKEKEMEKLKDLTVVSHWILQLCYVLSLPEPLIQIQPPSLFAVVFPS